MSNVYLVFWWCGYYDSGEHLDCIFLDEQQAITYASEFDLGHREEIWIEKREVGVKRTYKNTVKIYERVYHDPQEALWEEIRWVTETYDETKGDYVRIDKDTIIACSINNYSPMCVDIDWDLLYKRYIEQYD